MDNKMISLPPFAEKVLGKLRRFEECSSDNQGADIGRHWFDVLTQLGLLNRVQRSPALWEMTQQGEDLLAVHATSSTCAKTQVDDVVERQPMACGKCKGVGFLAGTQNCDRCLGTGNEPVNVAELYATIAQQAAEIERLKGGQPGFTFKYQHPLTKEIRSVSLAKTEVANGMEDTLYEKLVAQFCQCDSVGETNVVDCNCDEYIHDFDLVADDAKAEQSAPEPAEPILVEAVAVTRECEEAGLRLEWLLEGGIAALELPGAVLFVAHGTVTNEEGHGYVIPVTPPVALTNTSGQAHCPHCGVCHTAEETCVQALRRVLALYERTEHGSGGA